MIPLGKIQRRIWRLFLVKPSTFTTTELCRAVFPRSRGIVTDKHRHSVRRAALRVAAPVGRSISGKGRPLLWKAKTADKAVDYCYISL